MQKKIVQSFFIVLLVLGLLAGQSAAKFGDCYGACVITCSATGHQILGCAFKCLKDCIIGKPPPGLDHLINTNDFCRLGCATAKCSKLSTKEDPATEKVESCVNSCSETCTKI